MISIFERLYKIEGIDKNLIEVFENRVKLFEEEKKRCNPKNKIKIACVGFYNAGKSTLLNALIGKEFFKSGDIPTTDSVDIYEDENVIYIDTPGLNANENDNMIANLGYSDSDVILFLSDIQSGGLNATEAEYLIELKNTMGSIDILKENIIFVFSNKHQVEAENIDKIIIQHKENIKKVLGIEINNVYVYDALTYQEGFKNNEQKLLELSGIIELKSVLETVILEKNQKINEIRNERIKIKKSDVEESANLILKKILINFETVKNGLLENEKKINALENLKIEFNNRLQEFKMSSISDEPPRKAYIHFDYISSISDKKSRYEVESYIKSKLESRYNKRESIARDVVNDLSGFYRKYLEFENKDDNYYYNENIKATKLLLDYASKLKTYGIQLNTSLLREIQFIPQNNKEIISNISKDLSDDVVEYGQYYSLSFYVDKVDINEMEDYGRKGLFGGTKYTYSAYNFYDALDEMAKDLTKNIDRNVKYLWNKIKTTINKFDQEVNSEIEKRFSEIDKEINEKIKLYRNTDIEFYKNKIKEEMSLLNDYIDIPENL